MPAGGLANGTMYFPGLAGGPPPGSIVACPRAAELASDRFTPRVTAQYRLTDDVIAYASYSQGFKPGGYNTNEIIEFTDQLYQAERVAAYELGVKSGWFDDRLAVNVNGFYNDYTDQQMGDLGSQSVAGRTAIR
ncbi:MAG: TonB-dependent receptor, partial [Parasphingorhabdus sp.]|nr:TonB-dependent receptor [Parasphingorhabdus sp.]